MSKKIISLFLVIFVAANIIAAPTVTTPIDHFDGKYYSGIDIHKPPFTTIKLTDGTAVGTTCPGILSFGTPENNNVPGSTGFELLPHVQNSKDPSPLKFGVHFSMQQAGTIFVFFTSNNDLGFTPIAGAAQYDNPYMLMSVGATEGLNYKIVAKTEQDKTGVTFDDGIFTPTTTKKVINLGSTGGIDTVIKTGVCFRHHVSDADINGGTYVGHDIFELQIKRPLNTTLKSGLYYGHIIVHFTPR